MEQSIIRLPGLCFSLKFTLIKPAQNTSNFKLNIELNCIVFFCQ